MTLSIGQVLVGRYRIDALLGQGGMGAVYRAYDETLRRTCAIKEMVPPPYLGAGEIAELQEQFRQEASILASLSHPGLPRVTDRFTWGHSEVLVMDFVEGQSLEMLIQQAGGRPLDEGPVLGWVAQLLDALSYCHEHGILHRDVKPANIIITPAGRAVLVDFGLVKVWNPADPHTMTVLRGMGTPAYAPPEQYGVGTGHTDACSDIYSVGGTLYHALTGQKPVMATLRVAAPTSFAAPQTLNPALSPHTAAVIMTAMAIEKSRRFQSARDMLAAVERRAVPPPPVSRPAPSRSRAAPLLAAGAVAVVFLLAGILWFGNRGENAPAPRSPQLTLPPAGATEPAQLPTSPVDTAAPDTPVPAPTATTQLVANTQPPHTPSPTPTSVPPSPAVTATPAEPSRAEQERELLSSVSWREANGDPVFAPYTEAPPRLDGYLDEWTSAEYAVPYIVDGDEKWSGPADCSGRFYLAWDWGYLYLGIEVFDDVHVQEAKGRNLYKGDDIEIQIDTNRRGDIKATPTGVEDGQIGFTVVDWAGTYDAYIWLPSEQALSLTMAARQTADGYIVEAAVPWHAVGLNPEVEKPYGFCLNIGDNDSRGTKNQEAMVSNVASREWDTPTSWGTLILVDW